MPTEKEQLLITVTVMQVFEYMLENNVDRKHACEALGIPYASVNHMLARDPELLKGFLDKKRSTSQINLSQILMAQQEIIRQLLADASNEKLSMTERISLYNHLEMQQEKLACNLGIETEQEKSAKKFLQGAHLRPGTARVIKTETTELTFDVDNVVNLPSDIIDVVPVEHKPPNDFIDTEKE